MSILAYNKQPASYTSELKKHLKTHSDVVSVSVMAIVAYNKHRKPHFPRFAMSVVGVTDSSNTGKHII